MFTTETARPAGHAHHRERPMPADARAELQRLFKAYDAACLDLDADAAAAIYDLPCLISTPAGNTAFNARGELRQALARRFAAYRQQGIVCASITALDLESVAPDFATARVVWTLSDRRGNDVVSVPRRYTLRRSDAAPGRPWRIAHVVNLADPTAHLADRGRPLLQVAGG
jgi:ketosteroid isomerase-like protein